MVTTKEWFTVDEAAEYLRVSRRTIYKLTQDERLPSFRIGQERHRRFRREDLDRVPLAMSAVAEPPAALSGAEDKVLGELWNNDKDAAYDELLKRVRGKYSLRQLVSRIPKGYKAEEADWGAPVGKEAW
jgi:excisionase family DNA binding protein